MIPRKLQKKLNKRRADDSFRNLGVQNNLVDFSSNDYLGFSKNEVIYNRTLEILEQTNYKQNGATGSRLLTGNHSLYTLTESQIATFHNAEAALIYNSGYDANLGFFSSILQRGDIVFYDELCHASIRDGIRMSNATAIKFKHNNIADLKQKCHPEFVEGSLDNQLYIVTESVFSMDGDSPDLLLLAEFCKENQIYLIVDEAHAVGVVGKLGVGLVQELGIEKEIFARIITFGKALGCHGAAILGSEDLKLFLVNFSRNFIYTTGLPPHSIATIKACYENLTITAELIKLNRNIALLRSNIKNIGLSDTFTESNSAIQSCIISGNTHVKKLSEILNEAGYDVKPILSPTVPKGQERLRICIHSFNSETEIVALLGLIKNNI
jgi:8-amino-7-oxononanoate synthase